MFKKMEYVYAVYKEKSFTKAAEKLYVSQPCLSAAIKKIEDEIGLPLFERRYSDLRPTTIGYEYIKAAEKIMDIKEDFAAKVNSANDLQYGKLNVGGSNYVASYILPIIISEFSKNYPGIEISITESSSLELKKMLETEELDLIIDSLDEEPPSFDCFPLAQEKILLAVPTESHCNKGLEYAAITPQTIFESGFDANSAPKVSINHFKNEKFILLKRGHSMHQHASNVFSNANFVPNVCFRLDQLSTSYTLATSGNGACFVPDRLFRQHHFNDNIILYNIEGGGNRTLYISKKRTPFTSGITNKFIETAKSIIKIE